MKAQEVDKIREILNEMQEEIKEVGRKNRGLIDEDMKNLSLEEKLDILEEEITRQDRDIEILLRNTRILRGIMQIFDTDIKISKGN